MVWKINQKCQIIRLFIVKENAYLTARGPSVQGRWIFLEDAEMKSFGPSRNRAVHLLFKEGQQFGTTPFLPVTGGLYPTQNVRQNKRRNLLLVIQESFQRIEGRFHFQVQHVEPAGVVLRGEAVAPEAEFRTYPEFGLREKASIHLCKPLSIKAVAEPADGIGNIPVHGFRTDVQFHPEDHFGHVRIVYQRDILRFPVVRERFVPIGQHRQLAESFACSRMGTPAFDIVQGGSLPGIGQAQSGIIVSHHDETGLLTVLLQLRIRAEGKFRPNGEPLGGELLREKIRAVPKGVVRPFLLH